MINHFNKKRKNVQSSKLPILLEIIGQSNIPGSANSPSSWLIDNAPQYYGPISNAYMYNRLTGVFDAFNVGINHNGLIGMDATVFGVSPSLVKELSDWNAGQPIHVMQHGIPSTQLMIDAGLTDWNVSSVNEHYDVSCNKTLACITILNNLYGVNGWRGPFICWDQGNNDYQNYLAYYEENEINLINGKRTLYGRNNHFISSGVKALDALNNIKIANAAKSTLNHYFPVEDLNWGQSPHYDQASNIAHGLKFANLIKNLI